MTEVRWQRVNEEPFEYAIQKGSHGDEFVKLIDGSCLRRPLNNKIERLRAALSYYADGKVWEDDGDREIDTCPAWRDAGAKARNALNDEQTGDGK